VNVPHLDSDAPLCSSGKRPFRTEELAVKALEGSRWIRQHGDGARVPGEAEKRVFECPACRWWHLTSAPGARRRSELGNRGRRTPKKRR